MTRTKIERVECNRCGTITAFDDPDSAGKADWACLQASTLHGRSIIEGPEGPADLCPGCVDELLRWYRKDAELVTVLPAQEPEPFESDPEPPRKRKPRPRLQEVES